MRLSTDQRDTLHTIASIAWDSGDEDGTTEKVRYSAKQLAPRVSEKNAPRYFAKMETAGFLTRFQGEMGKTVAVKLTAKGVRVALDRQRELLPVIAITQLTEEECRRQRQFLPSTMERVESV